jgi:hypothetical protein
MREIPYPPPRAVKYPGIMDQQANYGERGASLAGGWRWLAPAFESIWRKAVPARTVARSLPYKLLQSGTP